jgi:predicted peptidase
VPGFHRRYLQPAQAGEDPRAYTVWLPPAYDGVKTFPILIFLHGSGERGFDGLAPAQVGLGPALVNHPDRYPYVVLFPQARERWSGDGTDMDAVVALLDDVTASYKVDPNRVALTGLSMGGAGCWNLALRMPERFRAVAPVCGFVDPARVTPLKNVPFWVVVGDADRLLPGSRGPVQALEALGARPVYKEHRGVGHNSWDRAYDDPAFARWLAERLEVHDGE